MEFATKELGAIEKVLSEKDVHPSWIKELAELELSMVGGGQGEVSFG
jgi:hypothetical protein